MARHHDDLLKTMTDEQKEIFEKFDDCWSEVQGWRCRPIESSISNNESGGSQPALRP
ncbi:MAG: hypothetical protein J6Q82_06345 [Clostridia bacterium]|nr:hypothetical protein [Clostridia bacterium]